MLIDATMAAGQIGHLLAGDGVRVEAGQKGICQLFAMVDGLAGVDVGLVDQMNQFNESISVASVPGFQKVNKNQMIARVAIVSDEVGAGVLVDVGAVCRETKAFELHGFTAQRVGLVITRLANTVDASVQQIQDILTQKVERLGSQIGRVSVVDHSAGAVSVALNTIIPHHKVALVFGAVDISNRDDVVPKAVLGVNGVIEHFGMPVNPGNKLLLAATADMALIGVPMCVRDVERSGFDIVLERLLAGVEIGSSEIISMGVGGLLDTQKAVG